MLVDEIHSVWRLDVVVSPEAGSAVEERRHAVTMLTGKSC